MALWPARYEHKSGAQASRYANIGQDCGSTKYGTIRKASFDTHIILSFSEFLHSFIIEHVFFSIHGKSESFTFKSRKLSF